MSDRKRCPTCGDYIKHSCLDDLRARVEKLATDVAVLMAPTSLEIATPWGPAEILLKVDARPATAESQKERALAPGWMVALEGWGICTSARHDTQAVSAKYRKKGGGGACDSCADALGVFVAPPSASPDSSNGGHAPSGFRVIGRSGPDVRQQVGLWIRRARDMRTGEAANGEIRRITSPSLGGVWDAGEYDVLEPITAEQPAPRILRSLSEAEREGFPVLTDEDINAALAEGARARQEAERHAPPAPDGGRLSASSLLRHLDIAIGQWRGMTALSDDTRLAWVSWLTRARGDVAALEAQLAETDRLRLGAEQAAATANTALEHYKAKLATAERERDEATAKERARCLLAVEEEFDAPGLPGSPTYHQAFEELQPRIERRIRGGTPDPNEPPTPKAGT